MTKGNGDVPNEVSRTPDQVQEGQRQATDALRPDMSNPDVARIGTTADATRVGDQPMSLADAAKGLDQLAASVSSIVSKLSPAARELLGQSLANNEYSHENYPLGTVLQAAFKVDPNNEAAMRNAVFSTVASINDRPRNNQG